MQPVDLLKMRMNSSEIIPARWLGQRRTKEMEPEPLVLLLKRRYRMQWTLTVWCGRWQIQSVLEQATSHKPKTWKWTIPMIQWRWTNKYWAIKRMSFTTWTLIRMMNPLSGRIL